MKNSKRKPSSKKKAFYLNYKVKNVASKNKQRKLLQHVAKHPNDSVAENAVGNLYPGKNKPRAKPPLSRSDAMLQKLERKVANVRQYLPKKDRSRKRKRPATIMFLAFKNAKL